VSLQESFFKNYVLQKKWSYINNEFDGRWFEGHPEVESNGKTLVTVTQKNVLCKFSFAVRPLMHITNL